VKHEDGKVDPGKLLCSDARHWRRGLQKSLAERDVPIQQRFCGVLSTVPVVSMLLIIIIFTGAICFCWLDLKGCPLAQAHGAFTSPNPFVSPLQKLCLSSAAATRKSIPQECGQ